MATQSFVQVAPDGAGKAMDAVTVPAAAGATQYRQTVAHGDSTFAGNVQSVDQAGGALTRSATVEDLLTQVLIELRCQNTILQATLNSRDDIDLLRLAEQSATLQTTQ